jgi:DNA-binding transcriptional regulator YhcF (GntR family)
MFETAKSTKVFQDVVAQIEDAILAGRVKTGDMLPSERDLKDMFRISRGTLREALRVLEQKGLIEIKLGVGGGSLVKTVDGGQVSESLGLLIRSQKVSLNQLAEFREGLEGTVAAALTGGCRAPAGAAGQGLRVRQGRGRAAQRFSRDRQTDPHDPGGDHPEPGLPECPQLHSLQHPPLLRQLPVHGRTGVEGKLPRLVRHRSCGRQGRLRKRRTTFPKTR